MFFHIQLSQLQKPAFRLLNCSASGGNKKFSRTGVRGDADHIPYRLQSDLRCVRIGFGTFCRKPYTRLERGGVKFCFAGRLPRPAMGPNTKRRQRIFDRKGKFICSAPYRPFCSLRLFLIHSHSRKPHPRRARPRSQAPIGSRCLPLIRPRPRKPDSDDT